MGRSSTTTGAERIERAVWPFIFGAWRSGRLLRSSTCAVCRRSMTSAASESPTPTWAISWCFTPHAARGTSVSSSTFSTAAALAAGASSRSTASQLWSSSSCSLAASPVSCSNAATVCSRSATACPALRSSSPCCRSSSVCCSSSSPCWRSSSVCCCSSSFCCSTSSSRVTSSSLAVSSSWLTATSPALAACSERRYSRAACSTPAVISVELLCMAKNSHSSARLSHCVESQIDLTNEIARHAAVVSHSSERRWCHSASRSTRV